MQRAFGLKQNKNIVDKDINTIESNNINNSENDVIKNVSVKSKKISIASYLSKVSLFSALAVVLMFFQFPIFPLIPFIEMDFSCVCSLMGGMLLGFPAGVLIELMKFCLKIIIMSTSTGAVGELSNLMISISVLLIPSIMYRYKKGLKWTICGMVSAIILGCFFACISNKFIIFPLFGVTDGMLGGLTVNEVIMTAVLPFNVIKITSVAVIVLLIHRKVNKILVKF